jgi:hypothetical protein
VCSVEVVAEDEQTLAQRKYNTRNWHQCRYPPDEIKDKRMTDNVNVE